MTAAENVESRLAALRALTDATLGRLDVEDLLAELLLRVRELIGADTAAVLFIDEVSHELVPRVACGIEEEVRENVHVPFGAGFAGSIAATRSPVNLDRVDATTVANPILWQKGIQKMLGVPLLRGEEVIGVLHVGRLEPRPFTDEDTALLEVVAERVVGATQNRELAVEQAAARVLERSLLPSSLPQCEGIELAACYAAAAERTVGGDWYDVFTLPSGQLWMVVGDVAGHGLRAAVVMGRIRSALRAYALLGESPERVLDQVDHKVQHFEIGTFATAVCVVADPPYDTLRIAVAGHPPPVVVVPGHDAALVDVRISPPLGVGRGQARESIALPFPRGSVLVCFTDGLVERRGEAIDVGLERLRSAVSTDSVDAVARVVMHSCIADTIPFDDIAVVVAQRS